MADGINSGETRVEKKMNEVKMKRTSSPDTEWRADYRVKYKVVKTAIK